MAAVIAHVTGTALAPGVSRNGRLYTRENIAAAVARGQARIADGKRPISMRTHHAADDDSTHIVGRVTKLWQDPGTGQAKYTAAIADTTHGRDIASLTDDSDGQPQFLRGVSIRGSWQSEPRTETVDGRQVQTADDLEISGLDYTAEPGVDDADVTHTRPPAESTHEPFPIVESAPEALVSLAEAAEPLKSGKAATPQTKASNYADPGYQPDKMKRYALDSKTQAKAAWSFINQASNAKNYTGPQLKRIKGRIKAALKRFGVEISADEGWIVDQLGVITEAAALAEHYAYDGDGNMAGSFCISLSNGPVNITISSYCVDPADLDLVGRAAMDGACQALAAIDPDMDGDMDVPGADAEDTDGDMGEADDDRMESAPVVAPLAEATPAEPEPVVEASPAAPGVQEQGTEDPDAPAAPVSTTAAPEPAADPNTETEEPVVTEPTTPAVESTPAATAPAGITLTNEQFQMLLEAARQPAVALSPAVTATVESAPAATPAPVAEAAPVPAAAPEPVAPVAPQVAETQEQMIARMVREGITSGIQDLVESGGIKAGRKGLAGRPVTETGAEQGLTALGIPEDWPQKPLHTYTAEERRQYIDRQWGEHVLGESYYTGRR